MALIDINDYKPQHITVILDQTEDRIRKPLYCVCCRNVVFEYYGGVKIILFGEYNEQTNRTEAVLDETGNEKTTDWFENLGVPTPIMCHGKLRVADQNTADGTRVIKCKSMYYKVK